MSKGSPSHPDMKVWQKVLIDSDKFCEHQCGFMAQVRYRAARQDIYLCWADAAVVIAHWVDVEFVTEDE